MRVWLLIILALLLLMGSGCSLVSSHSHENRSGNYVPESTFSEIRPGKTSADWVRATLGGPSQVTRLEDGSELWRWTYTEQKTSSGHLFLIFDGSSDKTENRSAFVEVKAGRVTRKWRT